MKGLELNDKIIAFFISGFKFSPNVNISRTLEFFLKIISFDFFIDEFFFEDVEIDEHLRNFYDFLFETIDLFHYSFTAISDLLNCFVFLVVLSFGFFE